MRRKQWCEGYYYIDAFAGPGKHTIRHSTSKRPSATQQVLAEIAQYGSEREEQNRFIAGSPRVALELKHPFSAYVFIDRDPGRVATLQELKAAYGRSRRIYIRQADCTKYLRDKVANNPSIDWRRNRAVVFLDPFGMQVGWNTIELLARTRAIEIFLNFPVGMAIQRLLRRKPERLPSSQRHRLDEYLGSNDWMTCLYQSERTLFEDTKQAKIERSGAALVKWYRERLRTIFAHVSKAALIRNTHGGHLYYLLLASPNPTGVTIANDILSAGEVV